MSEPLGWLTSLMLFVPPLCLLISLQPLSSLSGVFKAPLILLFISLLPHFFCPLLRRRSRPAHLFLLPLHSVLQMARWEAGGEEVLEELAGQTRSEEEGGLWRNLRLDWVRNWDQSCQTAVLLSRLGHTGKVQRASQHLQRLLRVQINSN